MSCILVYGFGCLAAMIAGLSLLSFGEGFGFCAELRAAVVILRLLYGYFCFILDCKLALMMTTMVMTLLRGYRPFIIYRSVSLSRLVYLCRMFSIIYL